MVTHYHVLCALQNVLLLPMLDQSHVLIAFSNVKNYVQQEREEGTILRSSSRKRIGLQRN